MPTLLALGVLVVGLLLVSAILALAVPSFIASLSLLISAVVAQVCKALNLEFHVFSLLITDVCLCALHNF